MGARHGRGMPMEPEPGRKGLGMTGMRARARTAGGELTVNQLDDGGVLLDVRVPKLAVQTNEQKDPHLISR